jgi:hypothetical protein
VIERDRCFLGRRPGRPREELESEVARLDAELHRTQVKLLRVMVDAEARARGQPRKAAVGERQARRLRAKKPDMRDILLGMAELMRIDDGEFRVTSWPDDEEK